MSWDKASGCTVREEEREIQLSSYRTRFESLIETTLKKKSPIMAGTFNRSRHMPKNPIRRCYRLEFERVFSLMPVISDTLYSPILRPGKLNDCSTINPTTFFKLFVYP